MQLVAEMQREPHATCMRLEERETEVETKTKTETEVPEEEPVKVATAWELG